MSTCHVQASAAIELYFYRELTEPDRDAVEQHLTACAECRRALEELIVIRTALESQPVVDAPPGGDWSAFMARLHQSTQAEKFGSGVTQRRRLLAFRPFRPLTTGLAAAALVALVTASVLIVMRYRALPPTGTPVQNAVVGERPAVVPSSAPGPESGAADAALAQVSEQLFERSKLVVLGLATKDSSSSSAVDWDYERNLATSLLSDTRLYRLAAEERGMKTLAGVMRDLELVLLQTSMSEASDSESLAQLQHLIRRRDLITKMDAVTTAGSLP